MLFVWFRCCRGRRPGRFRKIFMRGIFFFLAPMRKHATRQKKKKNTPRDMANLSVGQGARKTTPDIPRMRVCMYATLKNFVTSFFTTCEAVKPPTSGKSLSELQKDNTKAARHPFSPPSEREVRSRDQPLSGPSRLSTERERGVRDFFCLLKCVL